MSDRLIYITANRVASADGNVAAKFQRPIHRRAERFMQLPLQHFSKLTGGVNIFRPGSDGQYIGLPR